MGYVVISVLASFGGRGETRSYTPKPRKRHTLLVAEVYSVGGGALCYLGRQRQKGEFGANFEEV